MIIGNGDIASILPDVDDLIFFASGVSDSTEERLEEFDREKNLLLNQDNGKRIVYFSSLSVFYGDIAYVWHKKRMEKLIKALPNYTIIRIGNITWGNNPHTLLNFVKNKLKNNEEFEIRDEYRYLVDKEEFLHWINLIPSWNCEMNIPGRMMKVADIVQEIKEGKL